MAISIPAGAFASQVVPALGDLVGAFVEANAAKRAERNRAAREERARRLQVEDRTNERNLLVADRNAARQQAEEDRKADRDRAAAEAAAILRGENPQTVPGALALRQRALQLEDRDYLRNHQVEDRNAERSQKALRAQSILDASGVQLPVDPEADPLSLYPEDATALVTGLRTDRHQRAIEDINRSKAEKPGTDRMPPVIAQAVTKFIVAHQKRQDDAALLGQPAIPDLTDQDIAKFVQQLGGTSTAAPSATGVRKELKRSTLLATAARKGWTEQQAEAEARTRYGYTDIVDDTNAVTNVKP